MGKQFIDLFIPNNEHMITLPRLVFIIDEYLGGDRHIEYATAFIIQIMHIALLAYLSCKLFRDGVSRFAASIVGAAVLTNGGQWENFATGFQIQFLGVYFLASCSIIVFCISGSSVCKRLISALVALLACLTMASGALVFPVLALASLFRRRYMAAGLCLACFGVAAFAQSRIPLAAPLPRRIVDVAVFMTYLIGGFLPFRSPLAIWQQVRHG